MDFLGSCAKTKWCSALESPSRSLDSKDQPHTPNPTQPSYCNWKEVDLIQSDPGGWSRVNPAWYSLLCFLFEMEEEERKQNTGKWTFSLCLPSSLSLCPRSHRCISASLWEEGCLLSWSWLTEHVDERMEPPPLGHRAAPDARSTCHTFDSRSCKSVILGVLLFSLSY